MQTVFLVWLPGIGGLAAGLGVLTWLGGKSYLMLAKARQIRNADKLILTQGLLLKEICGTSSDYLPDDITQRINQQIAQTEAVTRKELT